MGYRRHNKMPAAIGSGPVRVFRGTIHAVDKVKYTCTVIPERGGQPISGVQLSPTFVNSEGAGSWFMPEVNSIVWLCTGSETSTPFVMASCALPTEYDQNDNEEDPNNYRMNRPVLNEGDHMISSRDGNFIILRRGGVVEIGANQVAQRFYMPIGNLIRDFCENYELITAGGSLTFTNRYEDESWGTDKTPFEFRLQLKDFSQDEPIIDLGFGRIEEEDDQAVVNGMSGQIVARLIINENFKCWVDKDGNVQTLTMGSTTYSRNGPCLEHDFGDHVHEVWGLCRRVLHANRNVEIGLNDTLSVKGNRTVSVDGNVSETVLGKTTRTLGGETETLNGDFTRTITGRVREQVNNFWSQRILDNRKLSVTKGSHTTVGGRHTIKVANTEADNVGFELQLLAGELRIHDVAGRVRITSGLIPELPYCEFQMKPQSPPADPIPSILLRVAQLYSIEVNNTGAQIKTPAGEISVDNAGTVKLGPEGRGYVVTTLSHPVDYVTGAPIMGSSSVAAGGLVATGPDALPSTFVSQF